MIVRRGYHRTAPRRCGFALAVTAILCSSSCAATGTSSDTTSPAPSAPASTTDSSPVSTLDDVRIRLVQVATLEQPLAIAVRPGDPALYVAEKTGTVVAIRTGTVDPAPVLDLTEQVSLGGEQGLLGLAFSPSGRFLYVTLKLYIMCEIRVGGQNPLDAL